MPYLVLVLVLTLSACGPPVAQGLWLVNESASHDCRSDATGQLTCSDPQALDPGISSGLLRVEAVDSGRLRVIDLQGHSILGKAYADGAQFRWYRTQRQGDCEQSLDIELSLKIVESDRLEGFRRVSDTRGDACNQPGLHDLGFLLEGQRYEDAGTEDTTP